MAYLTATGLNTLANNINNTFAKKSENKLYTGTTTPTGVSEGSILVDPDNLQGLALDSIEGATKVAGVEPDANSNVQLSAYLERNKAYSVGDCYMSMNLPGGYFVECTTAGTTGTAAEDYTPPQ